MSRPETKQGKELVVGDRFIGGEYQERTITAFDEHPGLNGSSARVLKAGDYGVTVFDDDTFRRTSSGAYIYTHLWFAYERQWRR